MATIQLANVKESRCHQVMATLLQFDCSARKHTGCISLDGQYFYKLASECLHWYGTAATASVFSDFSLLERVLPRS